MIRPIGTGLLGSSCRMAVEAAGEEVAAAAAANRHHYTPSMRLCSTQLTERLMSRACPLQQMRNQVDQVCLAEPGGPAATFALAIKLLN